MTEFDDVVDDFHFAVMEKNELKQQNASMLKALKFVQSLAKSSFHRTPRTLIQMCSFFDDIILPIIDKAISQVEGE